MRQSLVIWHDMTYHDMESKYVNNYYHKKKTNISQDKKHRLNDEQNTKDIISGNIRTTKRVRGIPTTLVTSSSICQPRMQVISPFLLISLRLTCLQFKDIHMIDHPIGLLEVWRVVLHVLHTSRTTSTHISEYRSRPVTAQSVIKDDHVLSEVWGGTRTGGVTKFKPGLYIIISTTRTTSGLQVMTRQVCDGDVHKACPRSRGRGSAVQPGLQEHCPSQSKRRGYSYRLATPGHRRHQWWVGWNNHLHERAQRCRWCHIPVEHSTIRQEKGQCGAVA